MQRADLEKRTRKFAVDVIRFVDTLRGRTNYLITRQLIRSATSIGANYREAVRAESRDDFVHKMNISSKEAAETEYWLELLSDLRGSREVGTLLRESNELLRILTASVKTARSRNLSPFDDPVEHFKNHQSSIIDHQSDRPESKKRPANDDRTPEMETC